MAGEVLGTGLEQAVCELLYPREGGRLVFRHGMVQAGPQNVKGYLFCAKRAVPFMLEAGGGSIVNVSCIHGHGGLPPRAAYAASEGAVIAITRELAVEWRDKGIRVNAVAPA